MEKVYKILGVDPGTNELGYSILQIEDSDLKVLCIGVISLRSYSSHQEKLKEIYLQLQEIIETYLPSHMAIESPFFGKNVQSMLKLGRAQGVAMAAAITMGLSIDEYSPKKIKLAVTGNGNASKEQVASMLNHILQIDLTNEKLDATDALATAYTHYNRLGTKSFSGKKYNNWTTFLKDHPEKLSK